MSTVLILSLLVGLALSQTVPPTTSPSQATRHPPHQHHNNTQHHNGTESKESDSYVFNYDGRTHNLIVRHNGNCYINTLTDTELSSIHTDDGLRAFETKFIASSSFIAWKPVDPSTLPKTVAKYCQHSKAAFKDM